MRESKLAVGMDLPTMPTGGGHGGLGLLPFGGLKYLGTAERACLVAGLRCSSTGGLFKNVG